MLLMLKDDRETVGDFVFTAGRVFRVIWRCDGAQVHVNGIGRPVTV